MREILFRGKRLDNGEWVEGDLLRFQNATVIHSYVEGCRVADNVDPATVGQYTGLTANGKRIFEGDILKSVCGCRFVAQWDDKNARFLGWTIGEERRIVYVDRDPKAEIIGNIHDNPELLKGAEGM